MLKRQTCNESVDGLVQFRREYHSSDALTPEVCSGRFSRRLVFNLQVLSYQLLVSEIVFLFQRVLRKYFQLPWRFHS